ncbi:MULTISPECIES: 4-hydroxythreonine-4-phosphate dehydrogenase PdxA [unclassified Pseudodesulfovibrio]|uniref:4-hydroxythreonine-4-phosphate dehydrogenase PdxA n=1 Tax=unclassified Pseudodesulfovibrio TaxID=2661612 RepID=UPI000FEBB619|nr:MULTISPECIES: 4-hydroxythreonine-4-phosphate dehydrogenase PdxA [unclassified Pseudodesulfovibrio]MCJ2163012.1 4-hydroxythreonine-4-phosphate dehydrogenase PdxA [Pseudodesulfovibrio sp. S3-i]RWU07008.1 4-hydroxythreonine-4-phosphate dehydrogenase PdxA [Pseudodesulfovibrio sp. S3]
MRSLCVTLGDPCGLGPELVVRHFLDAPPVTDKLLLIGPAPSLDRELARCDAPRFFHVIDSLEDFGQQGAGVFLFEPDALAGMDFVPGAPAVEGGLAAGVSLDAAIEALQSGMAEGLLTCPLNKAMLHAAGFDFPGHTEFLAEKLGVGADRVCMHLCGHDPEDTSPKLRVSLVTTHPRLRDVPELITQERVLHCLRLTAAFVRTLGLEGPVGVCGLNPHAGESGRIGDEEILTIIPALEQAAAEGLQAVGPIPGDTIFHFAAKGEYPAVLAMYHDQGLAPLKLLHFSQAVNVTLGLPYPRTSPDHGTGYDLVGTGKASIQSFQAALDMLFRLVGEAR